MSLFDELAAEAGTDVSQIPNDQKMAILRDKCEELVTLDNNIGELENQLESLKKKRVTVSQKELPDIFNDLSMDKFGLSNAGAFGVDLLLVPYFKASIPAEASDEVKRAAFDHLEDIGGGDIIRTEVKISLGRGETELANRIVEALRYWAEDNDLELPPANISMGVPWNSLTSFVKERFYFEQSEQFAKELQAAMEGELPPPVTMNLSLLNATAGQVVKIKERKK